jgi:hypothetical protein
VVAGAPPNNGHEAKSILRSLQNEANEAVHHATTAKDLDYTYGWRPQGEELNELAGEINHMDAKIRRLEEMRDSLSPEQQAAVDRMAGAVQLMAVSAQDAIRFGTSMPQDLWNPHYQKDLSDIYRNADQLTHTVSHALRESHNPRVETPSGS